MTVPVPDIPPNEVDPLAESTVIILESEFQGGSLTGLIRQMVGIPPKGFEFVEYAVGSAMFIILIAIVASVFVGFSKILGAK